MRDHISYQVFQRVVVIYKINLLACHIPAPKLP